MLAAAIAVPAVAYVLAAACVEELPPLPAYDLGEVEPSAVAGLRIGTVDVERVWRRSRRVAAWEGRLESSKRRARRGMGTIGDPTARERFVEREHERLEVLAGRARRESVAEIVRMVETLGKIGEYDFVFDRSAASEGDIEALLHADTNDLTELVITCLELGHTRSR